MTEEESPPADNLIYFNETFELENTKDVETQTQPICFLNGNTNEFNDILTNIQLNECRFYENTNSKNIQSNKTASIHLSKEEKEAEIIKETKKREMKTLLYCDFICNNPKLSFGICLGFHVFFMIITFVLLFNGIDILSLDFASLPVDISNDEHFLRTMAWQQRNKPEYIIDRGVDKNFIEIKQSISAESLELNFVVKNNNDNIFTARNLQSIKRVENQVINVPNYEQFCLKTQPAINCDKPRSILRFFDGSLPGFPSDDFFLNIKETLNKIKKSSNYAPMLQYFLSKDAIINSTYVYGSRTRLSLRFGGPLNDFRNIDDRRDEQKTKHEEFQLNNYGRILDDYTKNTIDDNLDFYYFSDIFFENFIFKTVLKDLALSIGSVLFIVFFLLIHTQSFWITFFAVYSIVNCFLITNLIYNLILRFTYLGNFHVLSIFVILGIGSDDVFVFYDTWRESGLYNFISLAHRLSYCYRKANMAIFYTSLTTALAFIVSATSPFLIVYSFGVFSSILVAINYLSVLIFFPTVIITYTIFWHEKNNCIHSFFCNKFCRQKNESLDINNNIERALLVRFFIGPYFRFISHKIIRWIILVVYAILLIIFAYFATRLQVNEGAPKFLKDNTNFGRFFADVSTKFQGDRDQVIGVYIVFGLNKQNRSACFHTDYKCKGKIDWDNKFNINKDGVQEEILKICNKLKSLPAHTIEALKIRRSLKTFTPEVQCFIEDMDKFYKNNQNKPIENKNYVHPYKNETAYEILNESMRSNDIYLKKFNLPSDYNRFEIALNWWLYDAFKKQTTGNGIKSDHFILYNKLLGEEKLNYTQIYRGNVSGQHIIEYGTKLKYAAILVNTTLSANLAFGDLGFEKGLEIRDLWEDLITDIKKKLPVELRGVWQTATSERYNTNSLWHWFQMQKILVKSAITGLTIGISIALPILTLATHNYITGILATFTIACATICVIGVLPICGWKLGLLESLNLMLVVGLAIDYIVHLAVGYSRSTNKLRRDRVKDSLMEVGISIVSGATTTLGGSLFLLFAQILIFVEFGVFVFATIAFSIFWALGFFTTVLAIIGPQYDTGSLKPFYKWITNKIC